MARIKNINFWKICLWCGEEFGANKDTAKYCNPKHNALFHQAKKVGRLPPYEMQLQTKQQGAVQIEDSAKQSETTINQPSGINWAKMEELAKSSNKYYEAYIYYSKRPEEAQVEWEKLNTVNEKYGWIDMVAGPRWRALNRVLGKDQ